METIIAARHAQEVVCTTNLRSTLHDCYDQVEKADNIGCLALLLHPVFIYVYIKKNIRTVARNLTINRNLIEI